LQEKQFTEEP